MTEPVLYDLDGHVATITYNRPDHLNAINGDMRQAMNAAWTRFKEEEEAWVAIVTGNGKAFCAGADMKDPDGSVGTWPGSFWEIPTQNSFESGWEIWKPTIAAVNGACVGYGLTGALACDFVIAAEEATFSYPEVRIGVPTIVGAIRLPGRIGWSHAMELLLTGDPIEVDRAAEMGLVWKVVPGEALMAEAWALAERLCQAAPLAARATKEMAWRGQRLPFTEAVRFGETMRRVAGRTDDAAEGVAAFLEKREPRWQGR